MLAIYSTADHSVFPIHCKYRTKIEDRITQLRVTSYQLSAAVVWERRVQGVHESAEIPRTQEAVRISYTSDAELTRDSPYLLFSSLLLGQNWQTAWLVFYSTVRRKLSRTILYNRRGREIIHSEKPPRLTKTILCLNITL